MSTIPVWSPPATPVPALLPATVDICVVGGGIAGVALLRALGGAGRRVALLERAGLAAGASGRNAGFLLAGVADSYVAAVSRHGRTAARELWALTVANHARLLELAGGRPVAHRRAGSLVVPADGEEAGELAASAQLLGEDGFDARLERQPPEAPRCAFPSLVVPGDGEVDPAAVVGAVASGVDRAASVHPGLEVLGLEPTGGSVRVHHSAGEMTAGAAVVAVNAWTGRLLPELGVRAVRAQMQATAPPAPMAPRGRPVYARRGFDYWRRIADGRLLVGGRRDVDRAGEVGDEDRVTAPVQDALDRLRADVGGGEEAVGHRWSGAMGFTDDGLPLVGAVPGRPGVLVCAGFNGHGMGMAVECARLVAAELVHGRPPPAWLRASRVAPGGLH